MSKICKNCGAVVEDAATFCFNCKSDPDVTPEAAVELRAAKKKKNTRTLIICAAILVIAVSLFFIIKGCSDNSPKGVISRYLNAGKNLDYNTELSLSYEANFNKDKSLDELKEEEKKEYDAMKEAGTLDSRKKEYQDVTYELGDVKTLDKDELEEAKSDLAETCKDTDQITEAARVKLTIKNKGEVVFDNAYCLAVKSGGKWYATEGYQIVGWSSGDFM